jgi:hypothetical protein
MTIRTAVLCWICLALGCSRTPSVAANSSSSAVAPIPESPTTNRPSASNVDIEMRNVHFHVADGIVLDIATLRGIMVPRTPGQPPIFDDQRSFVLQLYQAEIAIDTASLQTLFNRHVLGYQGAPLKDVEIKSEQGRLVMTGKLHKVVDVPFSTKASISVTADGSLQLHTESMKAAGVPVKGLMDLFGLELEDVVDLKRRRGIDIRDDDIVISPGAVLPPPEIRGHLTRVALVGNRLVQSFGGPATRSRRLVRPMPEARNYIYFGSGTIRFGKLTMSDADLQLIDLDPKDSFEFDPARYNVQLVAGYSKNTPQKGLKTFMPDIDDVPAMKRPRQRAANRAASRGAF